MIKARSKAWEQIKADNCKSRKLGKNDKARSKAWEQKRAENCKSRKLGMKKN